MNITAQGTYYVVEPRKHYVPANQREAAKRQAYEDIIRAANRLSR